MEDKDENTSEKLSENPDEPGSILKRIIKYLGGNSMEYVKSLKPKEALDFWLKAQKVMESKANPFRISHQPEEKPQNPTPPPDTNNENKENIP